MLDPLTITEELKDVDYTVDGSVTFKFMSGDMGSESDEDMIAFAMSKFKDMIIDIQEDLQHGQLSFQKIADVYGIPVADVELIAKEMMIQFDDSTYDDSMDGDFDSAMASAGFGTDEDYGYFGEDNE